MLFFIYTFILYAHAQTYCLCTQEFVYDPNGDCLNSANYGLENSCFRCPVTNASGTFNYCGSLPYLGFLSCGQNGAKAARDAACTAFGGDIAAGSYACLFNAGTNKSQTTACASLAPTTPTNAGSMPGILTSLGLFLFSLFI